MEVARPSFNNSRTAAARLGRRWVSLKSSMTDRSAFESITDNRRRRRSVMQHLIGASIAISVTAEGSVPAVSKVSASSPACAHRLIDTISLGALGARTRGRRCSTARRPSRPTSVVNTNAASAIDGTETRPDRLRHVIRSLLSGSIASAGLKPPSRLFLTVTD
jgi:hypothetical protein